MDHRLSNPPHTKPAFVSRLGGVCLLCVSALLIGCNQQSLSKAQMAYRQAELRSAERWINDYVKHEGDGINRVIAYLERGAIQRDQGDLEASNESFAVVDAALAEIDRSPDVSLSRETLAVVSNLNALPYRGKDYDRIMLYTFRALNYLELGQTQAARVELRRAYEQQRLAVQANAERIAEANQAAEESSAQRDTNNQGYDAARAQRDPGFQQNLNRQYASLDKYRGYADYVNPLTEWMQGVYFMGAAADGSDYEWSRKAFQRVAGMVPNSRYLADDLEHIERVAAGGAIEPTTYVLFATGTAPIRGQVRIDIPLFIFGGNVDYFGVNFPHLVENPRYLRDLSVRSEDRVYTTQMLCDMDAVIGEAFRQELPVIITKTLISAGAKATIAYALRESVDHKDEGVEALIRIATTLYQYAVNQADLRTWASLPKQFRVARLPTPASGTIEIDSGPGQPAQTITLEPGLINVVMVRSIVPYTPLRVSQFSIGKDTSP